MQTWGVPPLVDVPPELRTLVDGHPLVARLLAQRGILDKKRATAFLDPQAYRPALAHELPGVEFACAIIRQTIANGEAVRIWGDFDVDGQTSTALLYEALGAAGAHVSWALPVRKEGHGLNERAIREASADGIKLLITCDTGISDADLVAKANQLGLRIIITDHHDLPPRLPDALSIVNPKLLPVEHPVYQLSGAGVAFYLARGLLEGTPQADKLEDLVDLVALGLVADVAYQVDDVRYLIQCGIQALRCTRRVGLQALLQTAGVDPGHLGEDEIGFQLAPRLNAAGRLADAALAINLLLTQDEQEARALSGQLEALNRERQALTEAAYNAVEHRLQREPELSRQPILVVDGRDWEEGILGLVASALVQRYQRPALVISCRAGELCIGSARSVAGIDIHQAIASQQPVLVNQGGHPMAAGFTLQPENLDNFKRGIVEWAHGNGQVTAAEELLPIDALLPWTEITKQLAQEVTRLAPFGAGNPKPVLSTQGAIFLRSEDLSRRQATPHRRIFCVDSTGRQLAFTWFNAGSEEQPSPGQALDLAFTIQLSYWKAQERLSLELVAWRSHVQVSEPETASLIEGIELLAWRNLPDQATALRQLRAEYAGSLLVWAEGVSPVLEDTYTRVQLVSSPTPVTCLAVATAPPGPEVFTKVLLQLKPQVLVLLPPLPTRIYSAREFITTIAGMVRSALEDPVRQGRLDIERMAAYIGARTEAVAAVLRGLEANQVFALTERDGSLHALTTSEAVPDMEDDENNLTEQQKMEARQRTDEQARAALLYQLREMHAYRQAYRQVAARALFGIDEVELKEGRR
ncbi:MAG: single-stranded-DNA-specific exonuclease RecJ [Anaerolineae bacterium]